MDKLNIYPAIHEQRVDMSAAACAANVYYKDLLVEYMCPARAGNDDTSEIWEMAQLGTVTMRPHSRQISIPSNTTFTPSPFEVVNRNRAAKVNTKEPYRDVYLINRTYPTSSSDVVEFSYTWGVDFRNQYLSYFGGDGVIYLDVTFTATKDYEEEQADSAPSALSFTWDGFDQATFLYKQFRNMVINRDASGWNRVCYSMLYRYAIRWLRSKNSIPIMHCEWRTRDQNNSYHTWSSTCHVTLRQYTLSIGAQNAPPNEILLESQVRSRSPQPCQAATLEEIPQLSEAGITLDSEFNFEVIHDSETWVPE